MFTIIQPHQRQEQQDLLMLCFKLRKKVFADLLNWDVPVSGDIEKDIYDDADASYLVWISNDHKTLYGMVRLMPTTGPTLLHDVFHDTHSRNPELAQAGVWEGTRMCIDADRIKQDLNMDAGPALSLMFVALCEAALELKLSRLVSNFEACMSRVYRRAGLAYELHGKADCYGEKPVYCASFEVTPQVLANMRKKTGVDLPLFKKPRGFICPPENTELEAA